MQFPWCWRELYRDQSADSPADRTWLVQIVMDLALFSLTCLSVACELVRGSDMASSGTVWCRRRFILLSSPQPLAS